MVKLIHPELSYEVRGVLLNVYNALGPMLPEAYYQDAIALGLKERGIACTLEKSFEVYYEGERVGLYYVDTWIESGKILLELKVTPTIEPLHKAQAISYLKVSGADLAIVANYGGPSLEDQRLPNFLPENPSEFRWEARPTASRLPHAELINRILYACHRVHCVLGPGFLHQVYRRATLTELRRSGLGYDYVKKLPVEYKGCILGHQDVRLILVEDKVLLATFALQRTTDALSQKLKAHLRQMKLRLGILANFHDTALSVKVVRVT
jgi:GxxExxY protein